MAISDLFKFNRQKQVDFEKPVSGNIFRADTLDRIFSGLDEHQEPSELLRELGGRKCLKKMLQDDEICTAFNTRTDNIIGTDYTFDSESEDLNSFVEESIGHCLKQIIQDSMNALKYGFSVNELVWKMEGSDIILDKTCLRDPEDFVIDKFGTLKMRKNYKDVVDVEQGKYLLTRHRPDSQNPYGESLLLKLYYPYQMRRHGYDFWIKFLEKFGTPILYGKVPYEKDPKTGKSSIQMLSELLSGSKRPSGIATKPEGDIKLLTPSSQGVHFESFINVIDKRIQKVVLGQTMTTDNTNKTGSFAMAKVHDGVREDKRKADMRMIENSVNTLVDYFLWLNDINTPVTFRMKEEKGLGKDRAERDAILKNCGVGFNPSYYEKHYNLIEGEDFEISEINSDNTSVNEFHNVNSHLKQFGKPDKDDERIERDKKLYNEQSDASVDIDFLKDIVESADSKEDLIELMSLLPDEDTNFIDKLTEARMDSEMQGRTSAEKS